MADADQTRPVRYFRKVPFPSTTQQLVSLLDPHLSCLLRHVVLQDGVHEARNTCNQSTYLQENDLGEDMNFALTLQTIAKPISSRIKQQARESVHFIMNEIIRLSDVPVRMAGI
jgi:hypothetical protein